jgi:uncharacterized protein (DUF1697 family)
MKPKPVLVFRIARAIIGSCETESQLRDVIFFLKSPQDLDKVVQALETLVSQERFPKVKAVSLEEKAIRQEKIPALVSKLRNENFSARDLELLIAKVFHTQIPSNKVGLEKYVKKVSHNQKFEQIYNYFMSENVRKPALEDPWLKEMLNQQEKRANEHK